jgi:glycosyltransferase involved in cell wall biosynthesis
MVDYSFLSTMYNNISRVKACLDSILAAANGLDYEIIIVDNYSTDGSFEVLKNYARTYKNLKLFRSNCLRGLGRQISFEHSKGKYVIPIDMDTIYLSEKVHKFLCSYLQSEKNVLGIKTWGSFCVFPRNLIERVGGWRNYNVGEDMDILARLF